MTDFWRDLRGADLIRNLHGDPPYDVVKVAEKIAEELGPPSFHVVEIGCGMGRLQTVMMDAGYPVIGIDVNPLAIGACKRAGLNAHITEGNGRLRGYVADRCGDAYSVTVFQHLPEETQRAYLAELARVLRPGGRVVIQHVHGTEVGPQSRQVETHEWDGWCAEAGLELVSISLGLGHTDWLWFTMEKR